jgi:hypothetical protein
MGRFGPARRLCISTSAGLTVCAAAACSILGPTRHIPPAGSEGHTAGAVDPRYFREPAPRARETIFTALNLPAPTQVRTGAGTPGPEYWQQRVDYSIDASLEAGNVIRGRQVVTYTNNSPDPLPYLWIHLEQNLFRPDSTGALATEPETRFGPRGFDGGFNIHSCRLAGEGGADLPLHIHDTLARLDLPSAVEPRGGRVSFEVSWSFKVPPFGADRMGMQEVKDGTIFQIAQWFPAVAVYDDVHGWNTLPYLGQGEFYTNFGDYDVRLSVPRDHIVAATGVLRNPQEVLTETQRERLTRARESESPVMIVDEAEVARPESRPAGEGPLTWRFVAENVRTFAWASSAAFLWDACFLEESGPRARGAGDPGGTLVMSVYPREALPLWRQSSRMLRFSIDHYNRRWHRYPWPTATNVNGIVGGMEYPMIIFCAEREDEHGLYGVTTHEIGHNWFPMLVNTDERRHGWMDEGFNTFVNIYSERAYFKDDSRGRGQAAEMAREMARRQQQPMATVPDQVWRGRLGHLIYGKTAAALYLLREEVLGPERFDDAFRRYIDQWAFKSPQPADFFRCMEDAAGADLAWFWRGWVLETGTLDQAIADVRIDPQRGWVLATFDNRGELVMPVRYRVTYADNTAEDRRLPVEAWSTTNRWVAAWEAQGREVVRIEIDPDGVMPDVDRSNNVWIR